MDLLGGYGSSDGDSDGSSASVQSATGPAPPPPPPPAAGGGGISKKGRRLLSLGAVLPPEIFDRLARDEQGGSSSDSEQSAGSYAYSNGAGAGGGNGGASSTSKKKRAPKRKTVGPAGVGLGGGSAVPPPGEMGDLLRELRSAPSVGPAGGEHGQNATKKKPPPPPREEKLGMAFMTVTTTVASKKDVGVENIHASRPVAGLAAAPSAEAAESTRGDDMNRKKPAFAAATRRAAAPGVAVPRPGLSAAPAVRTGAAYAPPQQQKQQQQYQYQNNQHAQQQQQQYHQEPAMGAQQSRKKSRKELERSLRAGKFDALGDDARATTVHQDDLDYGGGYAPTEADLSEAAARTAAANAAKSGAAGLRMYDPSAGGDVDVGAEVSQKHRSKHQINQLVAKAAVLEAHRAGGVGPSGQRSVKGSNSRADAKRKYGW